MRRSTRYKIKKGIAIATLVVALAAIPTWILTLNNWWEAQKQLLLHDGPPLGGGGGGGF